MSGDGRFCARATNIVIILSKSSFYRSYRKARWLSYCNVMTVLNEMYIYCKYIKIMCIEYAIKNAVIKKL